MNKKKIAVLITVCFAVFLAGCKAKETGAKQEQSSEQMETETTAALAEAENLESSSMQEEETQPSSQKAASDVPDTQPQPAAQAAPGTQAAPKSGGSAGGQNNSTGNGSSGNKGQNGTAGREEGTTRQPSTQPQPATRPQPDTQPNTQPGSKPEQNTAPSQNTGGSYLKNMAQESFALQNDLRAQNGVPALSWSEELYESAKVRVAEIVQQFSHTRPDGSSCFTAFTGKWRNMGENIAYGQRSAQQVTQGWFNSEGHRKNMLRSNFNNAAVACYEYRGQIYWVTLFGER